MLAITRRPKQKIKIGDDVLIEVIKIKGKTVVFGINAPREIKITRPENDSKQAQFMLI